MAHMQTPCHTPWRTIMVVDDAQQGACLSPYSQSEWALQIFRYFMDQDLSSTLVFGGRWLVVANSGLILTTYLLSNLGETDYTKVKPHGQHPANTENVKKYIDFAAKNRLLVRCLSGAGTLVGKTGLAIARTMSSISRLLILISTLSISMTMLTPRVCAWWCTMRRQLLCA